ncbi:MAG: site-specific integrase [Gammaproteobacteria bacterium]
MTTHTVLGGKVRIYKRGKSQYWQCAARLGGQHIRTTTKEDSLARAKEVAEDWYFGLRGQQANGELKRPEKTFDQAADRFIEEYEALTEGLRSPKWVQGHRDRLRLHLRPFFGTMGVSEITPGKVMDYRVHRQQTSPTGKPPAANTIHNELVTLRQVLKTAQWHGWLQILPDLSMRYRQATKVVTRAWFDELEYKQLYEATRRRAQNPSSERDRWHAEQLHDFVLFMGNTGLRPDEAKLLQFRDVEIIEDEWSGDEILRIKVRGKRGEGWCYSMPGAVHPFRRLQARLRPLRDVVMEEPIPEEAYYEPELPDLLFPSDHKKAFNSILIACDLKFDREGKRRTAYSLRHTYICLRLIEGADIYQIAKNCRTSVEMIEKFYASHIRTVIRTEAVNRRGSKPRKIDKSRKTRK